MSSDGRETARRRDEQAVPASRDLSVNGPPTHVPSPLATAAAVAWRALVVVAALAVAVLILARLLLVVLPLLIALLLLTVLLPVTRWFEARRLPSALAALLTVLGGVLVLGAAVGLLVPQVIAGLGELTADVDLGLQTVTGALADFLGVDEAQIDRWVERGQDELSQRAGEIGGGLLAGAVAAFEFVTGALLSVVILFFLLKDRDRMAVWFVARTPPARRDDLRAVAGRAWTTLAGYFRGQAIVAAVDAAGIGLGLLVLGVPLVLPLTVLTFLAGFFPIVGAVSAGVVAVLVALVDGGLTDALLVLGVVVGVQQLESNVLQPAILGRALPLHPLVVLLAITAGAVTAGVVGAFLAVPVAAVVAAVANELRLRAEAQTVGAEARD